MFDNCRILIVVGVVFFFIGDGDDDVLDAADANDDFIVDGLLCDAISSDTVDSCVGVLDLLLPNCGTKPPGTCFQLFTWISVSSLLPLLLLSLFGLDLCR